MTLLEGWLVVTVLGMSVTASVAYSKGRQAARREILYHWARFTCPQCLAGPRAFLVHHSGCEHAWGAPVDIGLPPEDEA